MNEEAGTSPRADIEAAIEIVLNAPMRACGVTEPHLVHPHVYKHGGAAICANCLQPIMVKPHP